MKKSYLLSFIILLAISCEKDSPPKEEDYRTPYSGLFNYTTIKSTMVMCYDTTFPCNDGWEEINIDTILIISEVEEYDTIRVKMQFGDSIIGVDNRGDTVYQTIFPILSINGKLSFPEYPIGGHNYFTGFYKSYDTIEINLQFGYGIGAYDKYKIFGIRKY